MKVLLAISIIVAIGSCSPTIQQSTSSNTLYEEDLSRYRPSVPVSTIEENPKQVTNVEDIEYVEPTEHLRAEIDSVLRIKAARNEAIGYLPGYTIQVYSGRSRGAANRAKNLVYEVLMDEVGNVTYDQPMFRVKVGQYYTRLEAEKNFNLLRKRFRQALVLPERISLKE